MFDVTELVGHWGYLAVFVIVVLGNIGLPVPEETALLAAGYLVWRGDLSWSLILMVGIVSAVKSSAQVSFGRAGRPDPLHEARGAGSDPTA